MGYAYRKFTSAQVDLARVKSSYALRDSKRQPSDFSDNDLDGGNLDRMKQGGELKGRKVTVVSEVCSSRDQEATFNRVRREAFLEGSQEGVPGLMFLPSANARADGDDMGQGFVIDQVKPDSSARDCGIRVGDLACNIVGGNYPSCLLTGCCRAIHHAGRRRHGCNRR